MVVLGPPMFSNLASSLASSYDMQDIRHSHSKLNQAIKSLFENYRQTNSIMQDYDTYREGHDFCYPRKERQFTSIRDVSSSTKILGNQSHKQHNSHTSLTNIITS